MRCPDCQKFVSMNFEEPEVDSLEIDNDGQITASVIITRSCGECGTNLKTADLDMSTDQTEACKDHQNDDESETHDLSVEEDGINQVEEIGGRYAKSYFGAELCFIITCKCDPKFKVEGSVIDKVAAGAMEEC